MTTHHAAGFTINDTLWLDKIHPRMPRFVDLNPRQSLETAIGYDLPDPNPYCSTHHYFWSWMWKSRIDRRAGAAVWRRTGWDLECGTCGCYTDDTRFWKHSCAEHLMRLRQEMRTWVKTSPYDPDW